MAGNGQRPLKFPLETFDQMQDTFKDLSDEINNLIGIIDQSDVATKDNQWTKEGLTQLGLYSQQYELATYQVSQYADATDKLNADESARDSILNLNDARINIVADGI